MKPIPSDNYIVRPFRANKTWNINFTYLSASNPPEARIDLATQPPADWDEFLTGSEGRNVGGIYTRALYNSVQHSFYTGSRNDITGSRYIPLGTRMKQYYPTGSQFYVVNMAQRYFGEGIRPGSFVLTAAASTASIYDDGYGRLVCNSAPSGVVGNIFYGVGIAVVKQDTGSYSSSLITDKGMYLATGSQVEIEFSGIHTIYEHQIICTVEPGELNFSTNPTLRRPVISGSTSASVFTQTTGSVAADLVFSGTLEPYFTTIGLYNDRLELLAVAKVPRPIKRVINTQQTVIIRIDA